MARVNLRFRGSEQKFRTCFDYEGHEAWLEERE
jgi:hypothetical protein